MSKTYVSKHAPLDTLTPALPEGVLAAARRSPHATALVDGSTSERIDYGELASRSRRVAAGLAARGFGQGDVLGLHEPNSPGWAELSLGAMLAGGAVTGVHPAATKEEAAAQLADASAAVVADAPALAHSDGTPPEVPLERGSLALLPYSSGTTGRPKGVMLTCADGLDRRAGRPAQAHPARAFRRHDPPHPGGEDPQAQPRGSRARAREGLGNRSAAGVYSRAR